MVYDRLVESLEARQLMSVGADITLPDTPAPAAMRVTRAAVANPLMAIKGIYVGKITDAVYGKVDTRIAITKVEGKRIVGKLWIGSRTGVGVAPFLFDCSNSTMTVVSGKLTKFSLVVPGQYGNLVLKGTLLAPKHLKGVFNAFWGGGQPYKGTYDVTKIA